MNKPSDVLDAFDKALDVRNLWIDMQKQYIINEILWIDANYENTNSLRKHLLKCAGFNNRDANISYAKQLCSYSDKQIQEMVETRANVLYYGILRMESNKIDSKPLKLIVQELRSCNK